MLRQIVEVTLEREFDKENGLIGNCGKHESCSQGSKLSNDIN